MQERLEEIGAAKPAPEMPMDLGPEPGTTVGQSSPSPSEPSPAREADCAAAAGRRGDDVSATQLGTEDPTAAEVQELFEKLAAANPSGGSEDQWLATRSSSSTSSSSPPPSAKAAPPTIEAHDSDE